MLKLFFYHLIYIWKFENYFSKKNIKLRLILFYQFSHECTWENSNQFFSIKKKDHEKILSNGFLREREKKKDSTACDAENDHQSKVRYGGTSHITRNNNEAI